MSQLVIGRKEMEAIFRHAEETYPNECCGILTGHPGEAQDVREAHRARNIAEDPSDRYELDPIDHFRVRKHCEQGQQEVIGFYHSHPNYPARPSQIDTSRAWSDYSYLIVSVINGTVREFTCWRFNGSLRKFEEESIMIREAVDG